MRKRLPLSVWIGILLVALAIACVLGVAVGSVFINPGRVWATVWANLTHGTADPLDQQIVWDLRLPRVLMAAIVGAGLSLAGASLQGLVRNPLADPYIIGVSSGASFGAALVLAFGSAAVFGLSTSVAAFVGAIAVLVAVYAFAQRNGAFTDVRLVLAGVALGYVAMAGTSFVQLLSQPGQLRGILFWTMGSVAGSTWDGLLIPAIMVAIIGGWLITQSRGLNALALGDDDAIAVGVDLRTFRLSLLLAAALLTAVSVSAAGGIGFVGLIVPHAARMVVGADHRRLLPVSMLAGAVFLVLIDLAARTIGSPNEYPLTIFTAVIGGPFFLWLMRTPRAATQ